VVSPNAAELPILGARTPDVVEAAATVKSRLAAEGVSLSNRVWKPGAANSVHWQLQAWRVDTSFSLHSLALVNTLTSKGSLEPSKITKLIEQAFALRDMHAVIVILDEKDPEAVRAAREAGAFDFLGIDEIRNEEALVWRVLNAFIVARVRTTLKEGAGSHDRDLPSIQVGTPTRLSEDEIRAADARIDAAVAALPTADDRRARGHDLLRIVAPELRDPDSGRLNARRISEATGLSLAALARASGVTQQALSATPDSPGAQTGLLPIAQLSVLLDEMFTPEHKRIWLQTPHPRFDDRSPAQAIEAGDAELVALSIESALEGIPG
jgi:hypothetical protein